MKQTRLLLLSATLTTLALATTTVHAESGKPGRKGTIAAYETGSGTVIDSRACARKKHTWSYVTCGKILRARVKAKLCAELGKGSHKYLYQVGNSKKTKSSVYCKTGAATGSSSDARGNGNPGHKGSVAAYYPRRSKVFDSQRCYKNKYTTCGKLLRARVKRRICRLEGKGSHTYFYQVSDNKKTKSSVYCKR